MAAGHLLHASDEPSRRYRRRYAGCPPEHRRREARRGAQAPLLTNPREERVCRRPHLVLYDPVVTMASPPASYSCSRRTAARSSGVGVGVRHSPAATYQCTAHSSAAGVHRARAPPAPSSHRRRSRSASSGRVDLTRSMSWDDPAPGRADASPVTRSSNLAPMAMVAKCWAWLA